MSGIAIIGTTEASSEMVTAGLDDIRSASEGEFWTIIGVRPDSPDAIGFAIEWCVENEVAYDLIVEPSVFDKLDDAVKNGADKSIKAKDVEDKVLERLQEFGGDKLLILVGNEQPDDAVQTAAQSASDAGITVLDLADALVEVEFGEAVDDAAEEIEPDGSAEDVDAVDVNDGEEKPDYATVGAEAHGGDPAQQELLTEWANEAGITEEEQNAMSWNELAEKLNDMYDEANQAPAPKPVKEASKAAPAKTTKSAAADPVGWTAEALDGKTLKELRIIATQSGIEGAAKLGLEAVKDALIKLGTGSSSRSIGKPLAGAPDTGNTEANDALAQIMQGLTRLVALALK